MIILANAPTHRAGALRRKPKRPLWMRVAPLRGEAGARRQACVRIASHAFLPGRAVRILPVAQRFFFFFGDCAFPPGFFGGAGAAEPTPLEASLRRARSTVTESFTETVCPSATVKETDKVFASVSSVR